MKTTELKAGFQSGKYAELLKDIYIDESVLEYQKERYVKAIESFEELFGVKDVEIYSAPGRSEIGEIIQITSVEEFSLHLLI